MGFTLPAPESERGLNKRYLTLTGLQEFAILLPLAVLVVHMLERGLGLGVVGLAFAVRSVIVVLLEVPTGGLADAIGRKPIAILSQSFTLASIVTLLLVTGPAVALLYAVLQGVGAALNSGALDAWYVDSLKRLNPAANLQKNLARVELVRSSAMLAGAGLGGMLPSWTNDLALPWPLAGFGVSLFVGALFRILVLISTLLLVNEPEYRGRSVVAGLKAVPEILRDAARLTRRIPVVPYLLLAVLASGVALSSLETFWQPLTSLVMNASSENSAIFGVFGALTGAALLLGSFLVLQIKSLSSYSAMLAGGAQALKGLAMLFIGSATGGWQLGLGLSLAYLAVASNDIPHNTLLNEAIPSERRSVMLSLNSLCTFLGLALGSSVLGLLAVQSGPRMGLWVGGAFTLLASLAYVGVARAQRQSVAVEAPAEVPLEQAAEHILS